MTVFEDETLIRNIKNEVLFGRLSHPDSFIEENLIRRELQRRGVMPPIFNPFELSQNIHNPEFPSCFDTISLDPIRYVLGIDPAKDDTEIKINVKRRNIKFNFNN